MKQQLIELFQVGLDAVHGKQSICSGLSGISLNSDECCVISLGKAAQSMAEGAEHILGEKICKGLMITKEGHAEPEKLSDKWHCKEASHPVPDERSLQAGKLVIECIDKLPPHVPIIFLISGGTSSLVEHLPEHIDWQDLQKLNQWLMASGLDIERINQIRKAVSTIKGGRLHHYLEGRDVYALLISDVPGDKPHVIGSGLLFADDTQLDAGELPDWVQAMLSTEQSLCDTRAASFFHDIIASNSHALEAIRQKAISQGLTVHYHDEFLEGDARQTGERLAIYLRDQAPAGLHIWGGETTVELPEQPGRGGRNQHLALAAACQLAEHDGITFLAAGTDGTDGPTEDAGAIVDGQTLAQGQLAGLDAQACLDRADSGTFLEAAGDLLNTGPTGTNVMDVVIAYKQG